MDRRIILEQDGVDMEIQPAERDYMVAAQLIERVGAAQYTLADGVAWREIDTALREVARVAA